MPATDDADDQYQGDYDGDFKKAIATAGRLSEIDMSTITINWLNKCRCGNKSHTVKTVRGNETGLWDDDAVKCNSCGRGGVIQVCEGQARVLWETDEEMAEGKSMLEWAARHVGARD